MAGYATPSTIMISSPVSPLRQLARSDQPVNLSIRRLGLTLVQFAIMLRRSGLLLVKLEHLLDERHHAVGATDASGAG